MFDDAHGYKIYSLNINKRFYFKEINLYFKTGDMLRLNKFYDSLWMLQSMLLLLFDSFYYLNLQIPTCKNLGKQHWTVCEDTRKVLMLRNKVQLYKS